jgi:hypothetical protein
VVRVVRDIPAKVADGARAVVHVAVYAVTHPVAAVKAVVRAVKAMPVVKKAVSALKTAGKVLKAAGAAVKSAAVSVGRSVTKAAVSAGRFVKAHEAAIGGTVAGVAVYAGCEYLARGKDDGEGCAAASGAAASAVSYGITAAQRGGFSWKGLGEASATGADSAVASNAVLGLAGLSEAGVLYDAASGSYASDASAALTDTAEGEPSVSDDGGGGNSSCPTPGGNSFTAGTLVLLASGKAVPISQLKVGDKVEASDTRTGKDQPEKVTAVLVHHDTDLYNLTVKTAGGTEVIHTTSNHLFWDPYLDKWVSANKLSEGEHLKTPDGTLAVADGGTTPKVHDGWMWDLTVPGNNDHDFYVVGTVAAVLVHNCDIPWSSGSVSRASRALDEGSTSVSVSSRSEAEELFLGKYQGAGYRNATGFDGPGTRQYFGSKVGTYHWDDQLGEDGRVLGHGPGNSDGDFPHLQIHTLEGPIARIFWSP